MEQDEEDRLRALRSIEAELREALEEARGSYEEAMAIFEEAYMQAYQIGLDSAEGPHAIFKATQDFNIAF